MDYSDICSGLHSTNSRKYIIAESAVLAMDEENLIKFCEFVLSEEYEGVCYYLIEMKLLNDYVIMTAIFNFIVTTHEFYSPHYEMMSRLLESIEMSSDVVRKISQLIVHKKYDSELVDFLGIWIGRDPFLDNICDSVISRLFIRSS